MAYIDPYTGELVEDDIYQQAAVSPDGPAEETNPGYPATGSPPPSGTPPPGTTPPAANAGLPTSPGNYPGEMNYPGLTPEEVRAREQQVGGYLNDQFKAKIGRELDASEYAYAQTLYRNQGGDAYRRWIAQKAGSNGTGAGTYSGYVPGTTDYPIAGGKQFFQYPDWVPPDEGFNLNPNLPPVTVTPFQYPDFVGPTADTFTADPGYQFRDKQMETAFKNQRSSQGLLSTVGTIADLMSMKGGLASQEFGNVWNRQNQAWQGNRNNALDAWKSTYQTQGDAFTRALTSYLTGEQAKEADWERSRTTYGTNLGKEASSYGLNLDTSQLNLARDNSQFGNMLSLYNLMTRTLPTYTPSA